MNVLITGGAGFLGARLARRLLQKGTLLGPGGREEEIERLTLLDVVAPPDVRDRRVRVLTGNIADPTMVATAVDDDTDAIFHLAAIVSGQAEADFDLGMQINFDATRLILERARRNENRPRVVFTSSVAVFGAPLPPIVQDDTAAVPQSSYGAQKLMCELLVHDCSRKGFIDGRALRMPTISVRPGKPNKAASSFASGIIREPLAGVEAICPVPPETVMWLMSPGKAVENLVHGHDLDAEQLGASRIVNMPGLSVTVRDMVAALERVAGPEVSRRIRWERDPAVVRIVSSWPGRFATPRAEALGFQADASFDEMVRAYVADSGPAAAPKAAEREGASP
ncbi:MAG TPA: D-erythronate dehydrogenase [Anaeromyxobacteraceae bacterium]